MAMIDILENFRIVRSPDTQASDTALHTCIHIHIHNTYTHAHDAYTHAHDAYTHAHAHIYTRTQDRHKLLFASGSSGAEGWHINVGKGWDIRAI